MTARWQDQDREVFIPNYNRYPIMLTKGEGTRVWDDQGKEYLDFLAGIGVTSLGHCHPRVVEAIGRQAATLIHTSNLYATGPGLELAQRLTALTGLHRVLLCNSGTEAVETAIKLARKYHYRKGQPQRHVIVSLEGSFHGRTLGALAATGQPALQEGFGPLPEGFRYIPRGDLDALAAALKDETTAAFLMEPVQGEGGIHPSSPEYMAKAREWTAEHGVLLIVDEIQSGVGRTGTFCAYQGYGILPDIATLAKGLATGMPIGAVLATEEAAQGFAPGDHGTTFGGNPVACAAALAALQVMEEENILANVKTMGQRFLDALQKRLGAHPGVKSIRGLGLMVGIELACDARQVLEACWDAGLLGNVTSGSVLRLLPPLTVTADEVDQAVAIIADAVEKTAAGAAASAD